MFKVGELFRRNKSTLWTIGEEEALSQIDPSDKELTLLKNYYSGHFPKEKDYRRRNLQTLLNNWNSELDRARAWGLEEQKRLSKRLRHATGIITTMEAEIEGLETLPRLNGFDRERKSQTLNQLEGLRERKRCLALQLETYEG